MPRPTLLTPEIHTAVVDAVRSGLPIKHACDAVGIDTTTFHNWMRTGEHEEREPYVQFFHAVKRARADNVRERLARISKAAQGREIVVEKVVKKPNGEIQVERRFTRPDWTADAWYLERTDPQHFARQPGMTPDDATAIAANIVNLASQYIPEDKREEFTQKLNASLHRKKRRS